jgi:hypothetical protein
MVKLGNGNTDVSLANNGLSGAIPSELGKLNKLKSEFYLFSNNLCADIPTEVATLSSTGMVKLLHRAPLARIIKLLPSPGAVYLSVVSSTQLLHAHTHTRTHTRPRIPRPVTSTYSTDWQITEGNALGTACSGGPTSVGHAPIRYRRTSIFTSLNVHGFYRATYYRHQHDTITPVDGGPALIPTANDRYRQYSHITVTAAPHPFTKGSYSCADASAYSCADASAYSCADASAYSCANASAYSCADAGSHPSSDPGEFAPSSPPVQCQTLSFSATF